MALGILRRRLGEPLQAAHHHQEVLRLLAGCDVAARVPYSGGETVGRLASVARGLLEEP